MARALNESFPHLRTFTSMEGWGGHFLASTEPIAQGSASDLAARVPAEAARDLLEWGPATTVEDQFERVLKREFSPRILVDAPVPAEALSDDRPVNEYYFLRSIFTRPGDAASR